MRRRRRVPLKLAANSVKVQDCSVAFGFSEIRDRGDGGRQVRSGEPGSVAARRHWGFIRLLTDGFGRRGKRGPSDVHAIALWVVTNARAVIATGRQGPR